MARAKLSLRASAEVRVSKTKAGLLRRPCGDDRGLYRLDDPIEDVFRSHQGRGQADRVADRGIGPAAANAEEKAARQSFLRHLRAEPDRRRLARLVSDQLDAAH